jgi:hypothetical protein
MPPWKSEPGHGEFIGHGPLSDAEIDLIQRWVHEGAVEGDARGLPPRPQWTSGRQLGKPDLTVSPSQAYSLRAEGTDAFHVFVISIPIAVARYVKGIEFRPHNLQVVHHANILLDRTPTSRERNEQDPTLGEQGLLAVTPGWPPGYFLDAWATRTAASEGPLMAPRARDRSRGAAPYEAERQTGSSSILGWLFFIADPPERMPAVLRLGRQQFDIPPGERAYRVTDAYVLPVDVDVVALKPHAHYRAREVRGFATLPDGTTKWLLYIKDWDFKWQHVYRYVSPLVLPKGTTVTMQITYDNSAENPRNPQQPPERVRWGPLSSDEMGDLWIQVLTRNDGDLAMLNHNFRRK